MPAKKSEEVLVEYLTSMAGHRTGSNVPYSYERGDQVSIARDEANRLRSKGYIKFIDEEK